MSLIVGPGVGVGRGMRRLAGTSFLIAGRFVLLVDTSITGAGTVSNTNQFEITGAEVSTGTTFPVTFSPESDPFNYTEVTVDVADPTITFPSAGRYYVQIGQPFNRILFDGEGDRLKVVKSPLQYGSIEWNSFASAFRLCSNLDATKAADKPDLRNVTSMSRMFQNSGFDVYIGDWDIENLISMRFMFQDADMSCENYTHTLVAWFNQAFERTPNAPINVDAGRQDNIVFATSRSGGANFADAGAARAFATTPVAEGGLGWTISADIEQTNC